MAHSTALKNRKLTKTVPELDPILGSARQQTNSTSLIAVGPSNLVERRDGLSHQKTEAGCRTGEKKPVDLRKLMSGSVQQHDPFGHTPFAANKESELPYDKVDERR